MFVYSLRASTLKFFAVICVALVTLITLITFIPDYGSISASATNEQISENYNFDRVKTNDDRVAFLSQFGWEVSTQPIESVEVTIPSSFDKIFVGYNEIQKQQGLDLSRYRKKRVTRYTYEITNYEGYEGKVYANLIVFRGRVIAGDISAADPMGFVTGLEKGNT